MSPSSPPVSVKRPLVFGIVGLALLMMSIDSTIVATALHTLQLGLHATIDWVGWTLTAYSFGFAMMLPITGKLSERYGRRRVFITSVLVFTTASALCGLATNIYGLIVLRVLQAAGGAGFTPSATGIIVDHFGDARDRYVSLFGSIFPIGAMIGPIFGGYFVTYWTWRAVFLVNLPIGVTILLLALRYVPYDHPRERAARERLDLAGMLLLGAHLFSAMWTVHALGEGTGGAWLWILGSIVAATALVAFLRHVRRVEAPFIAPRLIYGESFGVMNAVNAIFSGVTLGSMALVPIYATNRYGIDALSSGTLLMAQGVATIFFSMLGVLTIRRTGYRLPILVGALVIAAGLFSLSRPPLSGIDPYRWLAGSAFLVGMGGGTLNPATRNAGLQLAPDHASTLAALRSLALQIGSITMVSVTTVILAASPNAGAVQSVIYAVAALVLVLALPMIRWVPEHRGAW